MPQLTLQVDGEEGCAGGEKDPPEEVALRFIVQTRALFRINECANNTGARSAGVNRDCPGLGRPWPHYDRLRS